MNMVVYLGEQIYGTDDIIGTAVSDVEARKMAEEYLNRCGDELSLPDDVEVWVLVPSTRQTRCIGAIKHRSVYEVTSNNESPATLGELLEERS